MTQAYEEGRSWFNGRQVSNLFGGPTRFADSLLLYRRQQVHISGNGLRAEKAIDELIINATREMRYLKRHPNERVIETDLNGSHLKIDALGADGILTHAGYQQAIEKGRIPSEADSGLMAGGPQDFEALLRLRIYQPDQGIDLTLD